MVPIQYSKTISSNTFPSKFILVDTDSAKISHNTNSENKIIYFKLKINKVIHPDEWGQPLYEEKPFTRYFTPQTYSYYDYITAWTNVLLLSPDTHSWFLWFKRGISLKFPKWFVTWFLDYGPIPAIFPDPVQEVYKYFKEKSTFVEGYCFISFVASQGIIWIMAWEYIYTRYSESVNIKILSRQVKIKWWKKFNIELVSKPKINEWLQLHKPPISQLDKTAAEETRFLAEKQQIMAELASATSASEFEARLAKVRQSEDTTKGGSDESTSAQSTSNPYLQNHDPFEDL